MKSFLVKSLLWLIEKICPQPNDKVAKQVLISAGKLLTYPHKTIYYKDRFPL